MAEPKKRLTKSRSGNRRSHLYDKALILGVCSNCNAALASHQVCPNCGFYKGKDVLKLEEKAKLKEERRKAQGEEEGHDHDHEGHDHHHHA